MARATPEPEQLVNDYVALWNGDFSKIDVVAESVEVYDPHAPDGEVHGREDFEAYVREVRDAFPDLTFTAEDVLASDDLVMAEWTGTGTHEGEYNGAAPTGREMTVRGVSKVQIADGEIRSDRIYTDPLEMHEQLGLVDD
ncbi:ester cyclase [Halomicrobium salinisoli]|uniref:ester cyclase n=1 Tax=Halomicrobium salinisoli TaxID=2878391 RepID=UPI001CF043AD|nr:ester cyclase [Halomicrobium salinisoli]